MKVQLLNKDIISLIYIGHLDSYAFGLLDLGFTINRLAI
jgi:hypothetical protein